jgi:hypothetical protein
LTQISEDYHLNLLAYLVRKTTSHTIKVYKHSDYYEPRWTLIVDGNYILRDATFVEVRKAITSYIPDSHK